MNAEKHNLIYGRNPVKEAIKKGIVLKLFLTTNFKNHTILDLLNNPKFDIQYISNAEMNNLATGANQGVAAYIKNIEYYSLESVIQLSKKETNPIILMLDGINDPHNFGAIIRCADVFGVKGIIISKHNQVPLNATVAKTSAGAINYVPICMVNNLNSAIQTLKDNGFWIVSSDGSASSSYLDLKYDFPTCLIIGSEGFGVSKLVLKNSDYVVKIPQYGQVNSLNASVACGILLAGIKR